MMEPWQKLINIEQAALLRDDIHNLEIEKIRPNPFQPRKVFLEQKLHELAQSIKTYGLLQPVVVRESGEYYQLIAGERRLQACRFLGWSTIPAVVREASDSAMATIALIENLQRENLNYLEEAEGYRKLLEDFHLTQEVIAQRIGKAQPTVANKLRLLKLPENVKKLLLDADLTERHARALLKLTSEQLQLKVVLEAGRKGLTVKQTERRIEELMTANSPPPDRVRKKVVIRDVRIFLNTVRRAVAILQAAGLVPEVTEQDCGEHLEIKIRLPKKRSSLSAASPKQA
jgi:ParB family chromosome partitioning protein